MEQITGVEPDSIPSDLIACISNKRLCIALFFGFSLSDFSDSLSDFRNGESAFSDTDCTRIAHEKSPVAYRGFFISASSSSDSIKNKLPYKSAHSCSFA